MKTQTLSATLVAALATSVSATWTGANPFKTPANCDNKCTTKQSGGFNWSDLSVGSFSSYGDFDFSGFTCSNSFSKRSELTPRTFQSKCITGKASKEVSSAPKISCGSSKEVEAFSIKTFQVSVEFDCDLDFHYDMGDGTTCKQTASCKTGGTTVKNTQCGGAKSVSVVMPKPPQGQKEECEIGFHGIDFDCNTPVTSTVVSKTQTKSKTTSSTEAASTSEVVSKTKSVETTPAAASSTTEAVSSETTPVKTTAQETTSAESSSVESSSASSSVETTAVESTSAVETTSAVESTSAVETTSASETIPVTTIPEVATTTEIVYTSVTTCPVTTTHTANGTTSTEVLTTVSTVILTSTSTICTKCEATPSSEAASSTTAPAQTSPVETGSVVKTTSAVETPAVVTSVNVKTTTEVVYTSVTTCPVTTTHTSAGVTSVETSSTISTILITSTYTTSAVVASSTTDAVASTTVPSGPLETAPCPDTLPQCMNTWLYVASCVDNTDSACYCPSNEFVTSVFECLSAYGASDSDISAAQTYFQGICAPYIPQNPAIVTGYTTIIVTSTASASTGAITPAPAVPVTTISYQTTITVPCTESTGISSGSVIPSSFSSTVISATITVPEVAFTTIPGATESAALVPGTPAAATPSTAQSTTAAIGATTLASVTASATKSSNLTTTATATGSIFTGGASSQSGMAFGSIGAAVLFAVFAI